jgi:hypothetical protein
MWEDELEASSRRKFAWLAGAVAAAVALAGWYWYSHRSASPVAQATPTLAPAPPADSGSQISHPIASDASDSGALPALNDSDPLAHDSLAGVIGRDPVEQFLIPQNIVRHLVVTVDNLTRKRVAVDLRPVKPTQGQTVVATQGEITTLSPQNYERYAPLMRVVGGTDMKSLALVYERLYPLFQQAYEDLGYPGKYFNDRLVEVIDNLLQTPEIATPIGLVQPRVFYEFADADLEARPAGQKLLIRMGPANERAIKAKLREFRAEIVKSK